MKEPFDPVCLDCRLAGVRCITCAVARIRKDQDRALKGWAKHRAARFIAEDIERRAAGGRP